MENDKPGPFRTKLRVKAKTETVGEDLAEPPVAAALPRRSLMEALQQAAAQTSAQRSPSSDASSDASHSPTAPSAPAKTGG